MTYPNTNGKSYWNLILFCILLSVYFPHKLAAQEGPILDSLLFLVKTLADDTNKVNTLLKATKEYTKVDPDKALEFSHQAEQLSTELGFFNGKMDVLYRQSYIYKMKGRLDSAIQYINQFIHLCDSVHDSTRLAKGFYQYGNLIRQKGHKDEALEYYLKSADFAKKHDDIKALIRCYNGIGNVFQNLSEFDSAVIYYMKTLNLIEEIGYESAMDIIMINLGKVYIMLQDYEKAKKYTQQSIEYSKKFNKLNSVALAKTNLGIISFKEHDYNQALEYYNEALELYKLIKNQKEISNLYINIGGVHKEQENYTKALRYYKKALVAHKQIDYKAGVISALMNIASVHSILGEFDTAFILFDSCIILTFETGDKSRRQEIYENMYDTYWEMGNYKNAFEYQTKYYQLKDSIFNIEKTEIIADLTFKYDKEKDQAQILALENENLEKDLSLRKRTNQRNIYLFSGSGTILIILFLFIFYRNKSRKDKIITDQKIKQLEEEKKLLAARFLVEGQEEERKRIAKELHDGLGVLLSTAKMQFTTIQDKSPENKPLLEKAAKLLEQATADVRKISHNMMPGLLTRFGLFEAVEDLIDKVDETKVINAKCEISGDTKRLPENIEIMLYRIIQEMANNTLKHAEAKNISLVINIQKDNLNIEYSDDGKGFNVEEKLQLKSIGLNSIQSRVSFLSGNITMQSEQGQGVNYAIHIPIV